MGYVEDVEVKGIKAFRFAMPVEVLQNSTENPANQGFCVTSRDCGHGPDTTCLGTGLLDLSACRNSFGRKGFIAGDQFGKSCTW